MSDRTVHARIEDGREVVRYDRAGKWYVEGDLSRVPVSVLTAAQIASIPGTQVYLGLPGGKKFDAAVRGV